MNGEIKYFSYCIKNISYNDNMRSTGYLSGLVNTISDSK